MSHEQMDENSLITFNRIITEALQLCNDQYDIYKSILQLPQPKYFAGTI
jgi:hypothetical protein